MRTDLFDFDLDEGCIAVRPVTPRDSARMLIVRPGEALEGKVVSDLPSLLNPGDALVFNKDRKSVV